MTRFVGPFWYGIDGEKVVGCGEYMIFNGVEAVNLLLDALNKP